MYLSIIRLDRNFMSSTWEKNTPYNWTIFKGRRSISQLGRLVDKVSGSSVLYEWFILVLVQKNVCQIFGRSCDSV